MSSRDHLNIIEALENLNTLVDAKSLDEIEVTEDAQFISHKDEKPREETYWVGASRHDLTEDAIKTTFRTVHNYLQSFYKKMRETGDTKRLVEGVNTIMVLVGEATKKLDRFGSVFREKVTDLEEYKELQSFYRNKVIKESYKEFAKSPIVPESQAQEEAQVDVEEEVEEVAGVHILNDVEVIKRDHLYELFTIKNEANHRFYTFDLARNIKLACDFGEFAKEYFGDDPLLQIKNWEDKSLHLLANKILASSKIEIEKFYKEALRYKEMDLVMSVHNALMALMLAANPRNLIRQFSLKGCHRYFYDFQFFLREALLNRDYQKFLLYSAPSSQPFFIALLDLVQSLCNDLFNLGEDLSEVQNAIKELTDREGKIRGKSLTESLQTAFGALSKTLKKHPNGPVFKALDLIRDEEEHLFDPLMQGNIPTKEGIIKLNGEEVELLRMACPIAQEFIHRAVIIEEFKTYLIASQRNQVPLRHLIVNYQDRTSWREHARCVAIEDLARQAEFAPVLIVVTLAKDTDFYNQMGVYHDLNEASEFIHQFRMHLDDEATGYHFPPKIKKELFPDFIDQLFTTIHQTFFDKRKTLTVSERQDFVEIAYHFIELKLIEILKPSHLSLLSKDGLDASGTALIGLIAMLGLGNEKTWSDEELQKIYRIVFGPTLIHRERIIHPERFERLCSIVNRWEERKDFLEAFAPLFNKTTLHAKFKIF